MREIQVHKIQVGKAGAVAPVDIINNDVRPYELYILNPSDTDTSVSIKYMFDKYTVVKEQNVVIPAHDVKVLNIDGVWPRVRVDAPSYIRVIVVRR